MQQIHKSWVMWPNDEAYYPHSSKNELINGSWATVLFKEFYPVIMYYWRYSKIDLEKKLLLYINKNQLSIFYKSMIWKITNNKLNYSKIQKYHRTYSKSVFGRFFLNLLNEKAMSNSLGPAYQHVHQRFKL